jgi:dolichol kinase
LKVRKIKLKPWRKILRLAAIIFPILYLFISKSQILWFTGIVLGIMLIPEIARFASPKSALAKFWKKLLFKEKEEKMKISAITLFLISAFIIILLFEKNIAIASIFIMIFGDLIAGIIGRLFGKHIVVRKTHKTIEGFLAFFWYCFIISLILTYFINLNIYLLLIASLFAAAAELFSYRIDDNLTVGLVAAISMAALRMFV